MNYFDRQASFLTMVILVLQAVIFYQHKVVLASIAEADAQSLQYVSGKASALGSVEGLQFMQQNYPAFQALVDNRRVVLKPKNADQEPFDRSESAMQRKMSWIKLLQESKTQFDIADMSFEVFPYQPITTESKKSPLAVGVESIVLQVSLLHDGVLAELMTFLRQSAPNTFTVSAIELERDNRGRDNNSLAQIAAEITIKWYLIEVEEGRSDVVS